MQALLTNIELDIQELKYLMDAFSREPNAALREVLKRSILQMRARLDQLLLELDAEQKSFEEKVESVRLEEQILEKQVPMDIEEEVLPEMDPVSPVNIQIDEKVQIPSTPILGERIRPAADLRCSISLNDSFRFSRELFNGDNEQMNRVIEQISEMSSLETAVAFLGSKVDVNEENEAMADFMEILKSILINLIPLVVWENYM